jgi:hypothetical protein
MLIFGALPLAPTADSPSWQLIVCDGMCSPLFETISSRRRGGAWFTSIDTPLNARIKHLLQTSDTAPSDSTVGNADSFELFAWTGPSLAATDMQCVKLKTSARAPVADTLPTFEILPTLPEAQYQISRVGDDFSVAIWNAKGLGRQLTSADGGCLLGTWLHKHHPTVVVIPEPSLPSRKFPKSAAYVQKVQNFAHGQEYVAYWTQHYSGQARGGVTILKLRDLSSGLCTESFNYDAWTSQVKAGVTSEAHSVWYVAAVQLTSVPHPMHPCLSEEPADLETPLHGRCS